jgi:hypothetical protein
VDELGGALHGLYQALLLFSECTDDAKTHFFSDFSGLDRFFRGFRGVQGFIGLQQKYI